MVLKKFKKKLSTIVEWRLLFLVIYPELFSCINLILYLYDIV